MSLDSYPNIKRAALAIGYDNGMIHRECSESKYLAQAEQGVITWLARMGNVAVARSRLANVEAALGALDDAQLDALCCGGEGEPEQAHAFSLLPAPLRGPINKLLNLIFEGE